MEQQTKSPIKILWFGFVGAICIYAFVGYQNLQAKNLAINLEIKDLSNTLFLIMAAISVGLIIFAHFYLPKLFTPAQPLAPEKDFPIKILQFAFSEAVGIFGLVLAFSQGSFTHLVVLCALALISLSRLYPEESSAV